MLATPTVPQLTGVGVPDLTGSFPLVLSLPPLVLVVLTMLVGIFTAAVTVVLIYHWRRFPFEHDTFRSAERLYLAGLVALFTVAVVGILTS